MRKELPIGPIVMPLPVVLIATYNEDETVNVMNAAWGVPYDFKQIFLNLSLDHKTVKNILRTKAFSIAYADVNHVAEADYVGLVSGNKVKNKLDACGLHAEKSEVVNAPVLVDFGLTLECKLNNDNVENGVIGDILRVSVDEKYIDENGKVDVAKLGIIAYDSINHGYYVIKDKVGQAFSDGRKFIK